MFSTNRRGLLPAFLRLRRELGNTLDTIMTSLPKTLGLAIAASCVLAATSYGDVTKSGKNAPEQVIAAEIGDLLSAEKSQLRGLSGKTLAAIATGPEKAAAVPGIPKVKLRKMKPQKSY